MQTDNRLLDDLARVATGALGALHEAKGEVRARVRDQLERVLGDLDLVSREEFDAVKAMAAAARAENEALAKRLAALEAGLSGTKRATKPKAEAKPRAKTAAKAASRAARRAAGGAKAGGAAKAKAGAARRRPRKG